MREEEFKGYDPFDALTSPVFGLPLLRSSKVFRMGAQQVLKRLPLNLRGLMGIKKGYNPVSLGLCVQGYSDLLSVYTENAEKYLGYMIELVDELVNVSSIGYSGICWGYDFDWEARYAKIDAFEPTVVATGIVVNGLFEGLRAVKSLELRAKSYKDKDVHDSFLDHQGMTTSEKKVDVKIKELKEKIEGMIVSAAEFVRRDLNKSVEGDGFCYSYSGKDTQKVLNASMKGVRILIQAYDISKNEELVQEAERAVRFVVDKQRDNGSWGYAVGDTRTWTDSFHTGYVLDCLKDFVDTTGKEEYKKFLEKGFEFFKKSFVGADGFPKYYDSEKFPADCTSAGQIILTLIKFGCLKDGLSVAKWMVDNMQDEKGYFYFQKQRFYTNRISYMRWSNAWMLAALSRVMREVKS